MSNLNPYEIRLQILGMAKDLLTDEYYSKSDKINQKYQETMRLFSGEGRPSYPEMPDFPTEEQIIDKANKLYKFVSETK